MCSYANDDAEFKRPRLSDNGEGKVVEQMGTMQGYTITKRWRQREEGETEERRKSREECQREASNTSVSDGDRVNKIKMK